MKKTNIAIIGLGKLGSKHVENYNRIKTVSIIATCDNNPKTINNLSKDLKRNFYTDYKKIPLKTLKAVSICVPTYLHYKIAKYFLENKIHCLVEKPIAINLKQANNLIKLAKKHKVILQVGHIERFNCAYQSIEKNIKNPKFIECHRLSPFPGRSLDVGAVLDIMIHDIDIVLGLVKSKIKHIDAVGVKVLTQFEDIANVRLTFSNKCSVNLTASRISDEYMRKIRIFLSNKYISMDYFKQEAFIYKKTAAGISKTAIPIEKEQPLKKELCSFLECVKSKKKPIVSGTEARDALCVALRIIKKINV